MRRILRRGTLGALGLASLASFPLPARAQPAVPPLAQASAPDRLERAKALFKRGAALAQAADYKGALELFLQSRAQVPSYKNTKNAAVCLTELERYDEALSMYEELFERFGGDIPEVERPDIEKEMVSLRARVGDIRVEGLEGTLYVDGRLRGDLPLEMPVHVMPGQHQVRLTRRGHVDFLRPVTLAPGGTMLIDVLATPQQSKDPDDGTPPPMPKPVVAGGHVQLFGGPLIGATLGSYAEAQVQSKCSDDCPLAVGGVFGVRGGYVFRNGLTLELSTGYLGVSSSFTRSAKGTFKVDGGDAPVPVHMALKHDVEMRGLFMGPSIGYRQSVGKRTTLVLRGTLALMSGQSADFVDGTAEKEGDNSISVRVRVGGQEKVFLSAPVFLMPEVGVEAAFGHLRLGASLSGILFLSSGPDVTNRRVEVAKQCGADKTAVGCAPAMFEYSPPADGADEPVYYGFGPTLLLMPQVFVGISL